MTLDLALLGKEIPNDIKNNLGLVNIEHLAFDGERKKGQLVIHRKLSEEVQEIFAKLLAISFPIEKMIPVSEYDWSDERSMGDNNTSAFNYRVIYGTSRLSNHSYGQAIDINPLLNPYINRDGKIFPEKAVYNTNERGTIVGGSAVVKIFTSYGWIWGGHWKSPKDFQHFEKLNV